MKPQQRAIVRPKQGTVLQAKVQEAIRLLGLSSHELSTFVKAEINENPFLTEAELDSVPSNAESPEDREDSRSDLYQDTLAESELVESNDDDWQDNSNPEFSGADSGIHSLDGIGQIADNPESIHEKLSKQIALARFNLKDQAIAYQLILHIDEKGYLRAEIAEIASLCDASVEEVESVLSACQKFEPTGVLARNLKECFKLQLVELDQYDQRMDLVLENLDIVASQDWNCLRAKTGLEQEEVREAINLLRQLSYRPFDSATSTGNPYTKPDVIVEQRQDQTYSVELNPAAFPNVLIDYDYISEITRTRSNSELNQYIENHTSRGNWLLEALNRRAITILRVASEIVQHQTPYLHHGLAKFQPLTARLVAERLALHESTISRAIANKYIETPRGIYPFSFFFSRASVTSSHDEGKSSQAVQEQIKSLIAAETPNAVLSDNQITKKLKQSGVSISRRTVTKYRENLGIPSSPERRRKLK